LHIYYFVSYVTIAPFRRLSLLLIVFVTVVSFISFCLGYDLEYILITSIVWSSVRFGQFISTNLIVLISIIAIIGTVQGLGTFSIQNNDPSGGHSLVLLQSFIVVIVVTTLSLIGILSEKNKRSPNCKDRKQS
jgi:integral membrane sensor domain MASE1